MLQSNLSGIDGTTTIATAATGSANDTATTTTTTPTTITILLLLRQRLILVLNGLLEVLQLPHLPSLCLVLASAECMLSLSLSNASTNRSMQRTAEQHSYTPQVAVSGKELDYE